MSNECAGIAQHSRGRDISVAMTNECAGFESYLRGSWWDVQIKGKRSGMVLVSYKALKEEEWAWKSISELRLSSRKADSWDCYMLKKGVEVSVFSEHPQSNALNLHQEAIYDAKISSVTRANHASGDCTCKFEVHFFSVEVKPYVDASAMHRIVLTDLPVTEVSISRVRILQQPGGKVPLHEALDAHIDQKWIPMQRVCKDASFLVFLPETGFSTNSRPCFQDTVTTCLRSDEDLSASAVWASTKTGYKASNCHSSVHGHQKDISGGSQCEEGEAKDRHEFLDEKKTCNHKRAMEQKEIPEEVHVVSDSYSGSKLHIHNARRKPRKARKGQDPATANLEKSLNYQKWKYRAQSTSPESPLSVNIEQKPISTENQKHHVTNNNMKQRLRRRPGRPRKVENKSSKKVNPVLRTKVQIKADRRVHKDPRIYSPAGLKGGCHGQEKDLELSGGHAVSSSSDSDSEGEWQPPYQIMKTHLAFKPKCTRNKTHQPTCCVDNPGDPLGEESLS